MGDNPHFFAIVHSPDREGVPIMLHAALHPDAASVAFASELPRLQHVGATGDLLVYCLATNRVVLRQSLRCGAEVDGQRFVARNPIPRLGEPLFGV